MEGMVFRVIDIFGEEGGVGSLGECLSSSILFIGND